MTQPLNSYVLIEIKKEEEKTAGGLYMPQGTNALAVDILKEGIVKAVSDKNADKLKIGTKVYYNKHSITKLPNNDLEVLVRFEDLYATVD